MPLPRPGDHVLYVSPEGFIRDALVLDVDLHAEGTPAVLRFVLERGVEDVARGVPWKGSVPPGRHLCWCWPNEVGIGD